MRAAPRRKLVHAAAGGSRRIRQRFLGAAATTDERVNDAEAATAAAGDDAGPSGAADPSAIPEYHAQGTAEFDAAAWQNLEFDDDPEDEAELRELVAGILDAALDEGHVLRDGWSNECLANASVDAGWPNPATAPGLFGLEPKAGPWALVARFNGSDVATNASAPAPWRAGPSRTAAEHTR